ncbi:MAG: hypothetical protein JRN22_00730 [Nitrososphaerota archaeon]|nr:hypothetical protein [Nitrososphaerota archaeon]
MTELYELPERGQPNHIGTIPFKNETVFQRFVLKYPRILGKTVALLFEYFPLSDSKIVDALAIDDNDSQRKLLIVEFKTYGSREALGQVLDYADWIVSNPEKISIKLRQKGIDLRDEEIKSPRLVIVAPSISDELISITQYVKRFEWDIVEVHHLATKKRHFLLVSRKQPSTEMRKQPLWELYRLNYHYENKHIESGKKLLRLLQDFCVQNKWKLEPPEQELYYGPALGEWNFNLRGAYRKSTDVFGIGPTLIFKDWSGERGWYLWFRLTNEPKPADVKAPSRKVEFTKWKTESEANYFYINLTGVENLFQKYIKGNYKLFRRALRDATW